MLDLALPYIRNVQAQSLWVKARDISCYLEAELVHNLSKSIFEKEIVEHDIWFLNNQARFYFENCSCSISPNYNQQTEYIKDLFNIVPDDLKSQLLWGGPGKN